MNRRLFLALAALGLTGFSDAPPPVTPGLGPNAWFIDWLSGFRARALSAGADPAILNGVLADLTPDPRVVALDGKQPEVTLPVGAYMRIAVNAERIAIGRNKCLTSPWLETLETVWGVPREILVAIWAMETRFGALTGDMDVIRSLATLAALGRRRAWAEQELLACVRILAEGFAPRERLRGSWAGAMGQTQMLPSTYLSAAVDGDGDGRRDIWTTPADAMASTANLLDRSGWRRDEGWAVEVVLRPGFDFGLSEGPAQPPSWWATQGALRADGRAWPAADAEADAILLLPSGATGPAFLALPNHFVIRRYNNALAYALAVGLLADGFAGGAGLVAPWPVEQPLTLSDRMDAQAALTRLGYYSGSPDGVIGVGTRQALRAWQKASGLAADGYLSPDMVRRLRAAIAPAQTAPPAPAQTLTPS